MRKIVGLIGHPLEHSLSPAMHNAAFQQLGIDYEYVPFEVLPKDLEEALTGLRALHLKGFNVTVPHKESVIPYLDEVTKIAEDIGAVNTVKIEDDKLIGYNTDGPGFIESLKQDAKFEPKGKKVVILGAGGASRAVAIVLAEAGAKTITLSDVIESKAKLLSDRLCALFGETAYHVLINSPELQKSIEQADLLVNASPIGMYPKVNESPLPENIKLNPKLLVYDLAYNPAETKLLKTAKAAGAKTCSGLGMLVRQGAEAFTIFTGEEAPVEVMRKAVEAELASQ
jgi:shikimate dehydrogenase